MRYRFASGGSRRRRGGTPGGAGGRPGGGIGVHPRPGYGRGRSGFLLDGVRREARRRARHRKRLRFHALRTRSHEPPRGQRRFLRGAARESRSEDAALGGANRGASAIPGPRQPAAFASRDRRGFGSAAGPRNPVDSRRLASLSRARRFRCRDSGGRRDGLRISFRPRSGSRPGGSIRRRARGQRQPRHGLRGPRRRDGNDRVPPDQRDRESREQRRAHGRRRGVRSRRRSLEAQRGGWNRLRHSRQFGQGLSRSERVRRPRSRRAPSARKRGDSRGQGADLATPGIHRGRLALEAASLQRAHAHLGRLRLGPRSHPLGRRSPGGGSPLGRGIRVVSRHRSAEITDALRRASGSRKRHRPGGGRRGGEDRVRDSRQRSGKSGPAIRRLRRGSRLQSLGARGVSSERRGRFAPELARRAASAAGPDFLGTGAILPALRRRPSRFLEGGTRSPPLRFPVPDFRRSSRRRRPRRRETFVSRFAPPGGAPVPTPSPPRGPAAFGPAGDGESSYGYSVDYLGVRYAVSGIFTEVGRGLLQLEGVAPADAAALVSELTGSWIEANLKSLPPK